MKVLIEENGSLVAKEAFGLKSAKEIFTKSRDEQCLGSNDYRHKASGDVYQDGHRVATISYNGRVWGTLGDYDSEILV